MRLVMMAAAFAIPAGAIALALTLRGPSTAPPLQVHAQSGSYGATVGVPLSVTAYRITNSSKAIVTIAKVRVAQAEPGVTVIGALAYRGCVTCVSDSAVPPHVSPPTDERAPPLIGVTDGFELKPGATLTLLLSVKVDRTGRVRVPPLRIDLAGNTRVPAIVTVPGPELCAGKGC